MMLSIDHWLPEQLKGAEDRWQALQARVFVVLLILFILPVVPAALIMTTVSFLGIINLWALAIVASLVSSGIFLCYYYFYHSANLPVASAIYSVLALLMVGTVIIYTGGFKSPVCVFLLTLPVLISLTTDLRSGSLFAFLVILFYGLLFLMFRADYPFQQVVADEYLSFTENALWGLTLISIVASLLLYDFSEKTLSSSLAEDRARLEHYAHYDDLTGALNEQGLFDEIEQSGVQHQRMLAYLSIDNITGIIQHFGFDVADLFVMEIIKKLRGELQEGWTLARCSTHAFVIYAQSTEASAEADKSQFNGMVYRIKQWNRKPITLSNGYRFLINIPVGVFMSSSPTVSARAMIDEARSNISHDD